MAEVQLKKVSPRHHQLIDYILTNQHEKGWALACCKHFGISRSWLSIVMNSDVFREEFTRRRVLHDEMLSREITTKAADVAVKALTRLQKVVEDDNVEDELALDVANKMMRNLGFGASSGAGPKLEKEVSRTQTREISPGVLEEARVTYRSVTRGEDPVPALGNS